MSNRCTISPVLDNFNFKFLLRLKTEEDGIHFIFESSNERDDTNQLITNLLNSVREKTESRIS